MAPDLADEIRQNAKKAYGLVPNFFEEMNAYTGAPGAVYMAADMSLMEGVLAPREQQAVLLAMARYHGSRYDSVVHARMALDAGLSPQTVDRLLAGEEVGDERLQALVDAAMRSCEQRGWLEAETLEEFERRGVSRGDLYEIFAIIGLKTFSSFTNHMAGTEVDAPLKDTEAMLEKVPDEPSDTGRQRLFSGS
jgi:alkylhydroperoxidase family enzyme